MSENNRKESIWELAKPANEQRLIEEMDAFFLSATPRWFDFVSWLLMLGALKYLDDTAQHWLIRTVFALSWIFFYFYLQRCLYNFPFYRLVPGRWINSDKFAFVFSISVGAAILVVVNLSLDTIVELIASTR